MNRGKDFYFPLCLTLTLLTTASHARQHVVAIAAHQGGPGETPLGFTERDAQRILRVFQDVGQAGLADSLLLTDPSPEEIRETFASLAGGRIKEGDTLIVYTSSHMDEQSIHLGPSRLLFEELFELGRATGASMRVFILDGCRSGSVTLKGIERKGLPRVIRPLPNPTKGEVVLTATSPNEDALESSHLSGSFFTHFLVTGLRGAADRDQDGHISVEEVFRFAHDNTVYATAGSPTGAQHPAFKLDVAGSGETILTIPKKPASPMACLRIKTTSDKVAYLLHRDSGLLEAEISLTQPIELWVPPGDYLVRIASAHGVEEGELSLAANGVIDPEEIPVSTVPLLTLVRKGQGSARSRPMLRFEFNAGGADIEDFGPAVGIAIGGSHEWRTVSLHLDLVYSYSYAHNNNVRFNLNRYGIRAGIAHPLQLGSITVSFGLNLEALLYYQALEPELPGVKTDGDRTVLGFAISPVVGLEFPLGSRWVPFFAFQGSIVFGQHETAHFSPICSLGMGWVF